MSTLESIRQSLISVFKTAHDALYPGVLCNYPNHAVVDIDRQRDPFVSVELVFQGAEQAMLGDSDTEAHGIMSVTFYVQDGDGMKSASEYADAIMQELAAQYASSGVFVFAPSIHTVRTFEGWSGLMLAFRFRSGV